jgi:DNA-binding FadR family transcriptional regulator
MNPDKERVILAYDAYLAARDLEAERLLQEFELMLDALCNQHPKLPRESLREHVIQAHLRWARAQDKKPAAIPPKA